MRRFLPLAVLAGLSAWFGIAWCVESDLGRAIYSIGAGRDGREIGGRIGADGGLRMQGGAVACGNCHGQDGRGGGEGWLQAPDLRWFALSKPHGRLRSDGSTRPAYDRASLARALRGGIAPDDVALDSAMPRYDLAEDEIDALIAHLRTLDGAGSAPVPPALVVLAPERGQGAATRLLDGLRRCTVAGERMPALTVLRYASFDDALAQLQAMEQAGTVAAVFAPYLPAVESAYARAPFQRSLPTLLPIALDGLEAAPDASLLFRLPSLRAQAHALLRALPARSGGTLIIQAGAGQALAEELGDAAQARGWRVGLTTDAQAASAADAVLVLMPLTAPAPVPVPAIDRATTLLVPALFMDPSAAEAWRARGARVRLAFPYPPRSQALAGRWIGPEQAWTALACELLTRLPPMPRSREALPAWRAQLPAMAPLRLDAWFELPARSDFDDEVGRVALMEWPERADPEEPR
ncbi:c-type cytochrome [Lysobacter sp. Root604]|uniref:c-type cytochrome n=1 Tax=Lysobacter sp. Root604 TaxID=1736568 RepID=UPI0006FA764C|nr:c-type cytochrome [Lysobacter sp. Root604]